MTEFLYTGFVWTVQLFVAGVAVYILGCVGSMLVGAALSVAERIRDANDHHGHAAA